LVMNTSFMNYEHIIDPDLRVRFEHHPNVPK
jgi:hypothetical protein